MLVNAKAEYNIEGEYPTIIENGSGTVEIDDGTTVTVENAPNGAIRLIVTPIPTSEKEAWSWITGCLKDKGTPIHAFDIYFADESGNRINANGAVVTIDCSHCTAKPMVYSLTTSGVSNNTRSVSVTFTTDGSHYYVMAEKASAPVVDDEQPDGDVTVEVTFKDKDTGTDDKPQTGDNSHLGLWITMAIISAAMLSFLFFRKRRKQEQ